MKVCEPNCLSWKCDGPCTCSGDYIGKLERELAEARKDAERYRWVRSGDRTYADWDDLAEHCEKSFDEYVDNAIRHNSITPEADESKSGAVS